ncbi:steroid receptor RNA activator 1 isoform X3 [Hypanus sabinus]|uniref:steroid receptor RNA activator 1 isoform X3 n=1 Tax=Hypanus sabinus TaxID=79690 RepID=UPI0028C44A0D|nr:steroid receptor RNA activator 1 isoform X3 [Hypanus sabinus]
MVSRFREEGWEQGNQERGWNDPPQFSYGLQTRAQIGQRKPFLTKRVIAPQMDLPPKVCGPTGIPPGLTPSGSSTLSQQRLPPPPKLSSLSNTCQPLQSTTVISECNVKEVEDVLTPLNKALEACRASVKKQVCDDIGRRLTILQDMWQNGKLSVSVQKRMYLLAQEMEHCKWDSADEIHRSLMVDHVNEVGQWMVGVKRLIAETKNLPSDIISCADKGCESGN